MQGEGTLQHLQGKLFDVNTGSFDRNLNICEFDHVAGNITSCSFLQRYCKVNNYRLVDEEKHVDDKALRYKYSIKDLVDQKIKWPRDEGDLEQVARGLIL